MIDFMVPTVLVARGEPSTIFLRGKTRREGSACPLEGSCALSGFVWATRWPWQSDSTLITPRSLEKRGTINENIIKISVFEKMGFHAGPCPDQNSSKTNVLEPGVAPGGSASKRCTEQEPQNQNWSVGSRAMIDFRVPTIYLCPTYFWCKTAHGAKTITLRSSFSTSHICVQPTFGAQCAETLLFEVPSLRVTCSGRWTLNLVPARGLVETAGTTTHVSTITTKT